MNFVTYAELVNDCKALARRLPRLFGVVGVARSGMIPASIIAQEQHCQLADLETFINGRFYEPGSRLRESPESDLILVVDDSCFASQTMDRVKRRIETVKHRWGQKIECAVVYVTTESADRVRHWAHVVDAPRLFEWNWLAHPRLERTLFDMDGILCQDPPPGRAESADVLGALAPIYLPRVPFRGIVTCRLQTWRQVTGHWLDRYKLKPMTVTMFPGEKPKDREGKHASWKAEQYVADESAELFVESCPTQAEEIARLSGKPVLCPPAGWRVFQ